ncbi:MAG: hypothetical protein UY23_C0001G0347 [Candidatus Jorgensenbacteria bacterium GW2011_GWA1_48_11]|uniref:Uncharacterized protein n=1 Tax=Candidatus Jorgensenbacteria bacterium GW2011_GWA1_48_11 TaxID=1618660 RepID=A0A0G1UC63_9BACT|nr:MAG: hypothetical protein UY23_C0001G0347 [Candidatus Jorgensenbacteria bacterium GW2011_GWA1_48_11]
MGESRLDVSQEHYENSSDTLREVTEQITGLALPPETVGKWRAILGAVRIIDDRLDAIPEEKEREQFASGVMNFLNGEVSSFSQDERLNNALGNVKDLVDGLSEVQRKSFLDSISRILNITEKIKTEEESSKFTTLTRLEGQVMGKVFIPFLPEEYRKSEKFPALLKVLTRLGRAANSFDTFIDLKEDYRKGRARVRPTALNRLLLFGATISDGMAFLKESKFSKNLIVHFTQRAKEVILQTSE